MVARVHGPCDPSVAVKVDIRGRAIDAPHRYRHVVAHLPAASVVGRAVPNTAVVPPVDAIGVEDRLVVVGDDLDTWAHVDKLRRRGDVGCTIANLALAVTSSHESNESWDKETHSSSTSNFRRDSGGRTYEYAT